ncbi:ADP-ribosylation factor-like protein 6-interacting protein 6 [Parambassis ranga]|uniref:ADP-ribosylation factor-like protein 6-interacting protein 6 n=1 Tax=Parambassis ranga TaxID=210632 RepID=A0A6P7JQJ8_9TELE|nr:ADP-ribosylation factor-like protein 6-interacting protein 6 [Parambassis ranga]XP_028279448.1 ADP-ribosylation factor-like protein 6-interacting protein 6 [Parambassis ranga]
MSAEGHDDTVRPLWTNRNWPKLRPVVVLSTLGSAAVVAAVGVFCAMFYLILKDLRAERLRAEDGTEERMLGFWSILVLSVLVGCVCCALSWTLTYIDLYQPGSAFPTPLTLHHHRDESSHDLLMSYGVAVLNGIMATLTVIWSLS